ncbi:MAG: nucleotidyltransferase family protein [Cellulosilyticaceae bacterium]
MQQVILFGSRAKGTSANNADIDLCIDCKGQSKGSLIFELEEIVGIYSLDIVFQDALGDEIAKQINRDGITIFTKE